MLDLFGLIDLLLTILGKRKGQSPPRWLLAITCRIVVLLILLTTFLLATTPWIRITALVGLLAVLVVLSIRSGLQMSARRARRLAPRAPTIPRVATTDTEHRL